MMDIWINGRLSQRGVRYFSAEYMAHVLGRRGWTCRMMKEIGVLALFTPDYEEKKIKIKLDNAVDNKAKS